uniref:Uncharacterized protein n=1 Tax=Molossus molossus TaxID=27622 RepID=A0A7J8FYD2_MOLMO|nr:hypothetical protein HJG59_008161 [Molossus molossus]
MLLIHQLGALCPPCPTREAGGPAGRKSKGAGDTPPAPPRVFQWPGSCPWGGGVWWADSHRLGRRPPDLHSGPPGLHSPQRTQRTVMPGAAGGEVMGTFPPAPLLPDLLPVWFPTWDVGQRLSLPGGGRAFPPALVAAPSLAQGLPYFHGYVEIAPPPLLTPTNIEQSTNSEQPPHWGGEQAGLWGPSLSPASLCCHGNPEPGSWDRWAPPGSWDHWVPGVSPSVGRRGW